MSENDLRCFLALLSRGFLMKSILAKCMLVATCLACSTAFAQSPGSNSDSDVQKLHQAFAHPPDDSRIMMRWWWFGPSATKDELKRELEQMKAAGIGGVEIATLYPLALDDAKTGFHNYDFVSDEHIGNLKFAAEEARRLGLRMDVTLGSGWPFGGPHIPVSEAAGELRVESVPVSAGEASVAKPALEAGESLIAGFVSPSGEKPGDFKDAKEMSLGPGARLELAGSGSARVVTFFVSSRTGMMVKRPSQGAAGFVLDHYDAAATRNHLEAVGDRLVSAFGDHPPYAVFSDSLEDYGSDWTPNLMAEFEKRRGYDLTPFLPALVGDMGPETAAIRHDWGETLTELANENFLKPMEEWARQHKTQLRSQTYGFPPVTLSSNRLVDLPEGEGKASIHMWRAFSDTRWAASAGHLFGKNVISSETWTWLHSPAFRATPLDMKAEADLHFLQGINQLIGHGWPYSPPQAGEPGWRMYAAGVFDAHNPWFMAMPDLTGYLQRVSYALRLGKPANDVAVLLPNDDVWASFKARIQKNKSALSVGGFDERGSNVSMDEQMPKFLGNEVIPQILDAGFNFDFIDADAIDTVGIPYKALVLPGLERISPEAYEKIVDFAKHGGIVIATIRLPDAAPGYRDADSIAAEVKRLSGELFRGQISTAHFVENEHGLGAELAKLVKPDFVAAPATPEVGFIHRKLESGDLYFVANTSNQRRSVQATFRAGGKSGEEWDPFTGAVKGLEDANRAELNLEPYESRLLYFSSTSLSPARKAVRIKKIDISKDWQFVAGDASSSMSTLRSWSEDAKLRYYSGTATYTKSVDVPKSFGRGGVRVFLDFGEGMPVPLPDPLPQFNMRAYLESPVREAGAVYVNDQLAGYVWHPPFRVDVTKLLKAGANSIRVVVGNTAINELAGTSLPNYRLLYSRYGVEFIPQGMEDLKPLPSGMLGPVSLVEGEAGR
ncbi:MAG: glycoside hydrolase [Acidobacteria bacterium]|nr:glycoside hydrolase [Acidobacteriota bacterium]